METKQGVGGYAASWRAYQLELALESFFFRHPLSTGDYPLSVSLGTDSNNPYSLTYQRGFLGLAPHSSASAGVVPPPLENWARAAGSSGCSPWLKVWERDLLLLGRPW